jgi:hypothetical protein
LNTALEHLQAYGDNANSYLSTIPGVSGIARGLGNDKANAFETDRTALASELAKAYKGGEATEGEIKVWEDRLNGNTPQQVQAKVLAAAKLLYSKLDSYNHQWSISAAPGTQPPMQIVSPEAADAYTHITGQKLSQPTNQATVPPVGSPTNPDVSVDPFAAVGGKSR